MADIQFSEDQQSHPPEQKNRKSLFVRLVLLSGIVSTEKAAEHVLLGIAALLFFISFVIYFFVGDSRPRVPQGIIDASMQPRSYR